MFFFLFFTRNQKADKLSASLPSSGLKFSKKYLGDTVKNSNSFAHDISMMASSNMTDHWVKCDSEFMCLCTYLYTNEGNMEVTNDA